MLEITAQRGGQLLKFGGDALLLLFTGPDHARQAASAAVEMRSELRRVSQVPTSVGKLKLKISIGAHSGAFHLFLVGDRYRQLVVGGPDTTVAMDAETAAEAGQIVVTDTMAGLLGRGSTKPRDDGQPMVTWRKGAVDPVGIPDRRAHPEAAAQVTPPIIASVLEHGAPDPEHRIATMAFFKFKGTDHASPTTVPTRLPTICTGRSRSPRLPSKPRTSRCSTSTSMPTAASCSAARDPRHGRGRRGPNAPRCSLDRRRRATAGPCRSGSIVAMCSPVSSVPTNRPCSRSWATP